MYGKRGVRIKTCDLKSNNLASTYVVDNLKTIELGNETRIPPNY
jgi:hypothetical protein